MFFARETWRANDEIGMRNAGRVSQGHSGAEFGVRSPRQHLFWRFGWKNGGPEIIRGRRHISLPCLTKAPCMSLQLGSAENYLRRRRFHVDGTSSPSRKLSLARRSLSQIPRQRVRWDNLQIAVRGF